MPKSMEYKEGMPYVIVVSSDDNTNGGGNMAQVTIPIEYGFWEDVPRLMRLQVKSFLLVNNQAEDAIAIRNGVVVMSSFKVKNYLSSPLNDRSNRSLSCIAHVAHDNYTSLEHVFLSKESFDVIVEKPQNGEALEFELWDSADNNLIVEGDQWFMTINLYPILESDTKY